MLTFSLAIKVSTIRSVLLEPQKSIIIKEKTKSSSRMQKANNKSDDARNCAETFFLQKGRDKEKEMESSPLYTNQRASEHRRQGIALLAVLEPHACRYLDILQARSHLRSEEVFG